jgi:GIY-YIG catalytic domain
VAGLARVPLWSVQEARSAIPSEPGFYAWWVVSGAIPGIPAPSHPSQPFELLYVGIAPRDANSGSSLRSRLCRQHIGGNVASSTFRFGLGALLWEREGWTPRRSQSGQYRLDPTDNAALSKWQLDYLRLQWFVITEPWRLERDVIKAMKPPMNRDHNHNHPFFEGMGGARDRFRETAHQFST